MADCVLIDVNHDGEVFNVTLADVPARKQDLVIDMLGEKQVLRLTV